MLMQNGTTVAGGNGKGHELNERSDPWSVYVNDDQTIYIADRSHHRIVEWKNNKVKRDVVIAGDQDYGKGMTEFAGPYGVIVDQLGTVYIVDCNNNRLMRWPKGAIEGSVKANQFHSPCDLSFDRQNSLYVEFSYMILSNR
jgi:sugar lactone lactonase YvrE